MPATQATLNDLLPLLTPETLDLMRLDLVGGAKATRNALTASGYLD